MAFEWDYRKNRKNKKRHKISFEEVIPVFDDPYTITDVYDKKHSKNEHRYLAYGYLVNRHSKVMISYTYRGDDVVRIISARKI